MSQLQSTRRFILLPSLAGLVCCACSATSSVSVEENLASSAITELPQLPQSGSMPPAAAPPTAALAYREGINLASSAYRLSQSAVSPDDWELIASRWQQAADQLNQLKVGDQHYAIAQQKIADYTHSANQAHAQIKALQQPVNLPPLARPTAPSVPTSPPSAITAQANQTQTNHTQASRAQDGRVTVPIVRRLHGTPVVAVTFNRAKTYEMILDTGASRTLITRQMANELGISATERMVAATASEAAVTFDIGQVPSIAIGNISLANARVTIGDSVNIGLLGNDFLQGYDVTIRDREVELSLSRS
jgi:predicted aspartyl protease